MAQQMESNQYNKRQEAEMMRQRKAATQESFNESNRMLIGIEAQQKYAKAQEAKQQQQIAGIAKAAMPRIGAENAAILQSLPYEAVGPALKEMLKAPKGEKVSTGIIEQVDEDGNTRNVLVNKDTGAVLQDLGIKKTALSAKDAKKEELDVAKRAQKLKGYEASAQNVQDRVAEALELVKNGTLTTGIGGQLTSAIGGSDARDLEAKLTTIKANLGFDRLQEMRDASPTGGALGQVAIQELVALQAAVDSLDQAQSAEALEKSLGVISQHYDRWLATMKGSNPGGAQEDPLGIR
jgi:hypothetical protein